MVKLSTNFSTRQVKNATNEILNEYQKTLLFVIFIIQIFSIFLPFMKEEFKFI